MADTSHEWWGALANVLAPALSEISPAVAASRLEKLWKTLPAPHVRAIRTSLRRFKLPAHGSKIAIDLTELRRWKAKGLSQQRMAQLLGVSKATVQRALRALAKADG